MMAEEGWVRVRRLGMVIGGMCLSSRVREEEVRGALSMAEQPSKEQQQ